jgi:hypothetical protein
VNTADEPGVDQTGTRATPSRTGGIVRGIGWAFYVALAAIGLAALVISPPGIDGFDDSPHWLAAAPVAVPAAAC